VRGFQNFKNLKFQKIKEGGGCFCERVSEKKFSKVGRDFYKGRYLYMGFIQEKRTGGGGLYIKGMSKKIF
jgi:hypothetical protein